MRKSSMILSVAITLVAIQGCTSPSQAFKPKPYPCVIGCGDERFTPDKGYYYDPSAPAKQRPLSEFYAKYR